MKYKIKNGLVYVYYNGAYWLDEALYTLYPELRAKGLCNG